MEGQRAHLRAPDRDGDLGRADLRGLATRREGDGHALHVLGRALGQPLLVEGVGLLPRAAGGQLDVRADAAGPAFQRGRPVPQRPHQPVLDPGEVLRDHQLGDRGGPVGRLVDHPVRAGHAHRAWPRPRPRPRRLRHPPTLASRVGSSLLISADPGVRRQGAGPGLVPGVLGRTGNAAGAAGPSRYATNIRLGTPAVRVRCASAVIRPRRAPRAGARRARSTRSAKARRRSAGMAAQSRNQERTPHAATGPPDAACPASARPPAGPPPARTRACPPRTPRSRRPGPAASRCAAASCRVEQVRVAQGGVAAEPADRRHQVDGVAEHGDRARRPGRQRGGGPEGDGVAGLRVGLGQRAPQRRVPARDQHVHRDPQRLVVEGQQVRRQQRRRGR